jgi:hypothetical protein
MAAVVDTMLKNGGERSFVFVIPVEEAHHCQSPLRRSPSLAPQEHLE